ncbi:MAG: hypothetical protein J5827_00295, partial [Oscillospiraceae bacterium]|nr:hypothetical protein [Oscillospiraceae bacterium]
SLKRIKSIKVKIKKASGKTKTVTLKAKDVIIKVIDAENGKYVFNSENGAAEGAAGDEKQGRGPFLSADGRYLYVIMDRDLSGFSLRGAYEDEAPIRGRFARK